MRRNFGSFKSNNSSNFSRNDRRDRSESDRNRFNNSNSYRKPMNRSFESSRNTSSDYKKPRRDFEDSRNSYQDHRRDNRDSSGNRSGGYGGGNNNDRFNNDRRSNEFRRSNDNSRDRSSGIRHHSPNRSGRDSFDSRGGGGFRSTDSAARRARNMSPPPPPSSASFRNTRDKPLGGIKSRLNPPLRSSIGSLRASGNSLARSRLGGRSNAGGNSRILRRNDLRSGLIAKRSAPTNRAKDYAKKIRQARMKLNERSGSGGDNEEKRQRSSSSTKKRSSKEKSPSSQKASVSREQSRNDLEEDYLAIANDENFDEDDNESTTGGKAKSVADEKDKDKGKDKLSQESEEAEKKSSVEPSTSKEEHHKDTKSSRHHRSPSADIDYICIHCDMHLSTANDYRNHLNRRTHMLAMRGVALKVRMTLNHLRKVQRDRQLEIEARIKDVEKINSKYCMVCKLNFRQTKDEHRESEDHKKIRSFLKPTCKICQIQLASPMKFEMHRCQLEHMRRKQKCQDGTDDEVDLNELDIGDFKTVDSVGDVDDEKITSEVAMHEEKEEEEVVEKDIGKDYISKVEAFYCSLCREYLSHRIDDEKVITEHCKDTYHQNKYHKYKKDDERKQKSSKTAESKTTKSPDKPVKQNGSDENAKSEEKHDEEKLKDENNSKDEKSKFKRYYENNDE